MNILAYFLAFLFVAAYLVIFDKVGKLKNFKFKNLIPAFLLIAVFIVRYFSIDKRPILSTGHPLFVGIDSFAKIGLGDGIAFLALIGDALSVTMFVVAVMSLFYEKFPAIDRFIRYIFPIGSIICLLTCTDISLILRGGENIELSVFTLTLMAECGAYLALSAFRWFKAIEEGWFKDKNNFSAKSIVTSLIVGVLIVLVTLPAYFVQFTYGYMRGYNYAYDMSRTHRVYVYLMFIIPLTIYFSLRGKDDRTIRFSLIFISVSTMITYSICYSYATLTDISSWPFHLCNTAMYVVPICLIFKWKRLFYFTYFINVLGAIFAMLMPNYDETLNIFTYEAFHFWINHWCAFFFPLICVALRQFDRPKLKLFGYSMFWFFVYFVLVLFLNVYFTAHGQSVDYFFINSDFIGDKLGKTGRDFFKNSRVEFTYGEYTYAFYPAYQLVFYLAYVGLGFGMWFVYELVFSISAEHRELYERRKKIRLDKYALMAKLNGRSIEEPMNPDAGTRLELKNFSKRYGTNKYYSVSGASLTVYGGEIFGFLGPNGAGKSTIIKSIVGIQPITEGSIEVCGFDCAKQPVMSKRQIGYVPDHYALYEKLTGREYINYIADIFEVSKEDREARINEYVSLFELESSIDNQIKTYSHGMKQKITIISALVHNPKLWILDEPLTGLDPNSIYQVKECMRRHARQGNIVFFSSHLIEVVEKLCDRVAIIKKGKIQCVKPIEEIEKESSLEEFYMKIVGEEDLDDEQRKLRELKMAERGNN